MKGNIFKELINNDNVNLYTKVLIILYQLDFYKKYYIPNQLFSNRLKIDIYSISKIIKRLKEDKVIRIYYKGSKRYFEFRNEELEQIKKDNLKYIKTEKEQAEIKEILAYNWLEDL